MDEIREYLSYDPETGLFVWLKSPGQRVRIGKLAGSLMGGGYLYIRFRSKAYLSHRLAWWFTYGKWPEGQIDHIDRDKTNNRLENLRDVSSRVNSQNHKKWSQGVFFDKSHKVWVAQTSFFGKSSYLGASKNKQKALDIYREFWEQKGVSLDENNRHVERLSEND